MTTERDPGTRIVLSWLREEAHENAERVLLRALDEVDTTQQRRSRWPAWRIFAMNPAYKIGLGAAALLVVSIVGYNVLPRNGIGNTPAVPTSAPTSSIDPTAVPAPLGAWPLTNGPLVAHEYFVRPYGPPNDSMTFTFDVPDGWEGFIPGGSDVTSVLPATGAGGPTGMAFGIGLVERIYSDPCKAEDSRGLPTVGDVDVGPTVEDLATAFREVTAYEASAPVDVELGGYSGLRVDLQLPLEFGCRSDKFFPWEGSAYAQGPGDRWHLWILDVEGVRAVVLARDFAATPAEDQAELQSIVDSLQITP
jgi:hypothetical protein